MKDINNSVFLFFKIRVNKNLIQLGVTNTIEWRCNLICCKSLICRFLCRLIPGNALPECDRFWKISTKSNKVNMFKSK